MLNKRILTLVFVVAFLTLLTGCLTTPPVNQAPIINSDPVLTAKVGVDYTYDVKATDPDEDTLTYSLTTKPNGMTIDSTTGVISWKPVWAQIGDNDVTVVVSDGDLSDTQSFTIKVSKPSPIPINHAPVITSSPITDAVMGVAYLYDVAATDSDGDTLTYSLTTNPSGMGINSANGVIDWIPNAEGGYAVEVKVSDGKKSDTQPFTITVKTVEITGIVVLPETMTLVIGRFETVQSVTAHYEIKSDFEVPIALGDCTYDSNNQAVATVSATGKVTGVGEGTTTITVSYAGLDGTVEVTVVLPVHNIDTDEYFGTIQIAIDDADTVAGHTIEVAPGTYAEGEIYINKSLTIQGAGKANTVIDADGAQYGIRIQTEPLWGTLDYVAVKDLTVKNADHSNINVYHTTVTNVVIENLDLSGPEVVDNLWSGLVLNGGTVENLLVEGCTFENIKRHGVRVDTSSVVGHLTVIDSDFSGNTEDALIIDGILSQAGIESCGNIDELTVSGCTFTGTVNGIRLFWYWTDRNTYSIDNVDIEGSTFEGNDASFFFYVRADGQMIGDIQIHYCSFTDSEWGINFDDSGTGEVYEHVVIDATYNWWGSEFGPKHNGFPVDGGDAVSDNVDYSNWSIVPY